MPGTPVSIGPFFGGMNDRNDPSTIEDVQCAYLYNFDIDVDGSIISRPSFFSSFQGQAGLEGLSGVIPLTTYVNIGQRFVIVSALDENDSFREIIAAIDYDTGIRTTVISTPSAKYTDVLQYDNTLWVISEAAPVNGGKWTPSAGWTSVSGIPSGIACTVYKERMFVVTKNGRLYFSKLADFTQWPASNFFDVNPGDGQKVQAIIQHMGQLIIFKDNSTYLFSYDSAPENASIQKVSSSIGTESRRSVVVHENMLYTFYNNSLYAINNWRWEDVSVKVHIADSPDAPTAPQEYRAGTAMLASVGRRIIVRYRTKFWVYFPDLEAWTRWGGRETPLTDYDDSWDIFLKIPWVRSDGYHEYWVGNYIQRRFDGSQNNINREYCFIDGYLNSPSGIVFDARLVSKMYDYQLPYNFKRLHWWGIDLEAKKTIEARVYPIAYNTKATWDDIRALNITWDQAAASGRTWDRPLDIAINVSDSYEIDYKSNLRAFIKYIKSLRFRKISFEVFTDDLDGTQNTGPLQIFSAIAVISNKQLGPRKAN